MSNSLLLQTPSQTVGPYFAYGLAAVQYNYGHVQVCDSNLVLDEAVEGERISITGRVFDGTGKAIPDAMMEIWQADAQGRFDNPLFKGFGRMGTGTQADNSFVFNTIKPGTIEGQAPHIMLIVFMRGLLTHAYTRLYFSDEAEANSNDALLNSVEPSRRHTLIAQREQKNGSILYKLDICMQGENETVFFDV